MEEFWVLFSLRTFENTHIISLELINQPTSEKLARTFHSVTANYAVFVVPLMPIFLHETK